MFVFFIALILQTVIEREVRLNMKAEEIEAVPIYPENRLASHPTTTKIIDRFYDVSRYHLREAPTTIVKAFTDTLSKTQKEILKLFKISERQYWSFPDWRNSGKVHSRFRRK